MKHIFWLLENKLAGRTGPNCNPWDLTELKQQGITAILSVNNADAVHVDLMQQLGIAWANAPMSPNAPIQPGDLEQCLANLPKAMAFIETHVPRGPVVVHCRSGKDRTGLVLASYLMRTEGLDVQQAMNRVLAVRSIAYSATGWMDFAAQVLARFDESCSQSPQTR